MKKKKPRTGPKPAKPKKASSAPPPEHAPEEKVGTDPINSPGGGGKGTSTEGPKKV